MPANSVTISARGVILVGQSFVDINICLPKCPRKMFLVQGIHVGPEVVIGATSIDIIKLPKWAVSVPVYQLFPSAQIQVALTALSQGAEHVSATLPAGQSIGPSAGSASIPVRITLLGGVTATHRFEFNVHLTGVCGVAFTCQQTNGEKKTRSAGSKNQKLKTAR